MEIKKDCEASTSDFWYDLTAGGYLNPKDICANPEDAERVISAIAVIQEFQDSCEEQIEGFLQ